MATSPVGVFEPDSATVPVKVTLCPWVKVWPAVGEVRVTLDFANVTLLQSVISVLTSSDPSPVARS